MIKRDKVKVKKNSRQHRSGSRAAFVLSLDLSHQTITLGMGHSEYLSEF